ncbi:NADPH-dependent F420 reductase [Sphingobium chlorophenolicum L-1]|uniref:NADPH-dependent F420 reductase n=1 Tax=Sphingobium chlorophenolicum L-1 TaxID=690566 RepID=F6EWB4_SPHCR|nr:NADPH-dependent F420 reductase [Sphingobium chlorophenolicum]AEG49808.1 NADPH-dependent F420 reductase [Sphingobium chlorophenolicum L-1]
MTDTKVISVIGGAGKLGAAIATRLAKSGRTVIIGSRVSETAEKAAAQFGFGLTGKVNADAARAGDIVIVTVPFAAQDATLAEIKPHIQGKIVVDTTVPLNPPKVMRVQLPEEGSAAVKAQRMLGDGVTVVSAFHNVAAHKLMTDTDIDCDVLVFGDDKKARADVVELANAAGLRGIHGGALVNSAAAEAMTSLLIFINKTYQVDGAGLKITGNLVPPVD